MDRFKKLDELLEGFAQNSVPNCACAIAKDEEIIYEGYFGYADLDTKEALNERHLYRQASMTKLVTYTILMMLYERGKFLMHQPISDFFPEWADKMKFVRNPDGSVDTVPLQNPITVKDAVIMSCGMPYCFGPAPEDTTNNTLRAMSKAMEPLWAKGHYNIREVIRVMADAPVAFEPGTHWLYGYGSELVAGIVEELTGMPLYMAMRKYIFEPLEMTDTDTLFRDDLEQRLVSAYAITENGFSKMPKSFDKSQNPGEENEDAKPSLMSNVRDFSKLLQMWAGKGIYKGQRILGPKTIDLMRTNCLSPEALIEFQAENNGYNAGYGYGYGVRTLLDRYPGGASGSLGSFGWTGGFGTWCEADPEEHFSIVYMHNMMPNKETYHHHRVRAIAYGCLD